MASNHKLEFTPGEALAMRIVLSRYIDQMIEDGKRGSAITQNAERAYEKLCGEREAARNLGKL